ncbi:hypothetical protein CLAIMM_09132 [Cladophialophora immunda]|nr:hypothetical protein CLAIMM_09132 [Cladophialophora immunda]
MAVQEERQGLEVSVDETTSLLRQHPHLEQQSHDSYKTLIRHSEVEAAEDVQDEASKTEKPFPKAIIRTVFPILLMGVFLANGDSSVVLATNQHIASEFDALSSAAWLLTTYTLAQCSSQPLYGKLSDIFGRKRNLAFCWTSFAIGCMIIGISRTYWQVLAGRAISGIGASGMVALTSIVVADLLPLRYVAQYRAYINFTATMARSIGGPTGGWLAGSIGWRWCFVAQCPLALCGLALVLWRLPEHNQPDSTENSAEGEEESKAGSKLARIDFLGAFALMGTVLTCLLSLDQGTKGMSWHYLVPLVCAFVVFATTFIVVEKSYAKEPILPLQLISKRDVFTPYLIVSCQSAGQFGLLYGIPIYFQVAAGESVSRAGSRIVPVVIGNATGTLLGGHLISKTKRYKYLTVCGICCSLTCFTLMCLRWHGATNWAESCYVYLAGFGMGTTQSTTFVHLAASLEHAEIAIAGTTWFLAQSFGSLEPRRVGGQGHDHSTRHVERRIHPQTARRHPKDRGQSYITSLVNSDGLSIFFVSCALMATLTLRERPL